MCVNCDCPKTMTAFVDCMATLVWDQKDAANNIHNEECCIEKLNAAFQEHKDMLAHAQALEAQDSVLAQQLGGGMPPHAATGNFMNCLSMPSFQTNTAVKIGQHGDVIPLIA